ncbi:MAG: hypothetical protein Solivirus1_54 [Solivirus sp.]|uniref:Ankyrin repeat protein n=1 Tax=Solivirus sp. TaxID=2487772 RepID=A0A3G5AFE1_9VIRU|nr:MAG: hypothetical protein Solivirus1_54 [Solivirus sp.]
MTDQNLRYPSQLQKRYANTVLPDLPNEVIIEILAAVDHLTFDLLSDTNEFISYCSVRSVFSERLFKKRVRNTYKRKIIEFKPEQMKWREFYTGMVYLEYTEEINLNSLLEVRSNGHKIICNLVTKGKLMEVKLCYSLFYNPARQNSTYADIAASRGDLDIVKWLYETYTILPTGTGIYDATSNGHLNILEYIFSKDDFLLPNMRLMNLAAANGHLHVLKWIYERMRYFGPITFYRNHPVNYKEVTEWLKSKNIIYSTNF